MLEEILPERLFLDKSSDSNCFNTLIFFKEREVMIDIPRLDPIINDQYVEPRRSRGN